MTISDDVQQKICTLYAEGWSLTLIQKHTHVGRLAVKSAIMRAGAYDPKLPFYISAKTPVAKSLSRMSLVSQDDNFVAAMRSAHSDKENTLVRVAK